MKAKSHARYYGSNSAYEIIAAAEGDSALEFLSRCAVDLIVLDWNMPGMDEADLLHAIRRGMGLKTPVLILSASPDEANVRQARMLGASGWLQKSNGLDALIHRVSLTLP